MASPRHLAALLHGQVVAEVQRGRNRLLRLEYHGDQTGPGATPLSLSLPPEQRRFTGIAVENYLWSLLPENQDAREAAAREHGADAEDPLSLLDAIGLDCAGAVQFCRPEHVEDALSRREELEPADDIEYRLAEMEMDAASSWIMSKDHWSLPGMQQKFTLRREGGRWFYPRGAAPSTHIVKPGIRDLPHQALVEHLTMRAATSLGVDVAHTGYVDFGSQRAIVVERFDRERDPAGGVLRLHQEDLCQALGIRTKYEDQGGPNARRVVRLLRDSSHTSAAAERNVRAFVDALIFNTIVAAPDAHARNYAVLLERDSVHFAPIYDAATGLAYDPGPGGRTLSMSVADCYDPGAIGDDHWKAMAESLAVDEVHVLRRVRELREGLPDAFEEAAAEVEDWDGAVSAVMSHIRPEFTR